MAEDSCVRTSLVIGVLVLLASVSCHQEQAVESESGPCTQDSECYELNPELRCHPAAGVCYHPTSLDPYASAADAASYEPTRVFSCPAGVAKCEALPSNGVRWGEAPPGDAVEGPRSVDDH